MAEPAKSLGRRLGFWAVFSIAAGAMISSGLFVLPGQAFKVAGPAVVLAYALAALMVVPALLSKAELATAMPKSGGDYFFVERSMGALPGTLAGLASWVSLALKSAFAMVGIGAFARLLWPGADLTEAEWEWFIKAVAVACCAGFTVLNLLSVEVAGRIQTVMVAALLVVLAVFVVTGLPHVRQHPNFDHFMASGTDALFATSALVFVSFGGLTKVASVAEEVRQPGRNLPRAMFLAFAVVALFYVGAVFVVVGTCDAEALAAGPYGSLTPLSLAAERFLGRPGALVLAAAAILAFVTTGNSGILSASRSPLAMSRDGLLPAVFSRVSKRWGTPWVSVLATSGFMIGMILLLNLGDLVKVASAMKLMLFLLTNVAVLVMRGSRIQNYRPLYRSPLYPWMQVAGILIYAALIVVLGTKMGVAPALAAGGFVVGGVVWHLAYARPRGARESALVHLVRRVLAREFRRSALETELREIALERDEVVRDRFDRLVERCPVLDVPGGLSADEMFRQAAEVLSPRLGVKAEVLLEKLRAREAESSTVIQRGLAIPHVVVDGEGLFDLVLVRSKEGIDFGGGQPPVHTAFILVGSPDERNFHLRALSAVAQMVLDPGFEKAWTSAGDAEALRDVVLLGKRARR